MKLAFLATLLAAFPASAAPITYQFDSMEFLGGLTARGTITTDGTLGWWPYGHPGILAFDIEFFLGGELAARLASPEARSQLTSGLIASEQALSFAALADGTGLTHGNLLAFFDGETFNASETRWYLPHCWGGATAATRPSSGGGPTTPCSIAPRPRSASPCPSLPPRCSSPEVYSRSRPCAVRSAAIRRSYLSRK
jgi:hypothetical protein